MNKTERAAHIAKLYQQDAEQNAAAADLIQTLVRIGIPKNLIQADAHGEVFIRHDDMPKGIDRAVKSAVQAGDLIIDVADKGLIFSGRK